MVADTDAPRYMTKMFLFEFIQWLKSLCEREGGVKAVSGQSRCVDEAARGAWVYYNDEGMEEGLTGP